MGVSRYYAYPSRAPLKTDSPAPPHPFAAERPLASRTMAHTPIPTTPVSGGEDPSSLPQVGPSSPCPSLAVFPRVRLKLASSWDHIPAGSFTLLLFTPASNENSSSKHHLNRNPHFGAACEEAD